jgi:mRNA-degrading endonuclease HigB of HigAB toxin-antitoxin module
MSIISYNIDKIIYKYTQKDKEYSVMLDELLENTEYIKSLLDHRRNWNRRLVSYETGNIKEMFKITRNKYHDNKWIIGSMF